MRTFLSSHDGGLLGLFLPKVSENPFLAHRGEIYVLNEARHLNILTGGKFPYIFTITKEFLTFLESMTT